MKSASSRQEGLPFVRLAMIISSLAPLFLLWAVRGIEPVSDKWLIPTCAALILIPNGILVVRIWIAKKRQDKQTIAVGIGEDHRDHLFVYLFAMLLPLFDANIGNSRDSAATVTALLFVIFLFWHLNLHYVNILFALFEYRVFTVRASAEAQPIVLLTRRNTLLPGSKVQAYRLSNSVFMERGSA